MIARAMPKWRGKTRGLMLAAFIGVAYGAASTAAPPAYEREIQDLRRLPAEDCQNCLLMRAFDSVIPIPNRFSISLKLQRTYPCVSFIAPADDLLHRKPQDPIAKLKERGTVVFCRPEALDRDAAAVEKEAPPLQKFIRAGISVTEFAPAKLSNGVVLYRAYFRTEQEGLMINDPNPDLWKAMLEVLERTKVNASSAW